MLFSNFVLGAVLAVSQIFSAGAIPLLVKKAPANLQNPLSGHNIHNTTWENTVNTTTPVVQHATHNTIRNDGPDQHLQRRQSLDYESIKCNANFGPMSSLAWAKDIQDGINYLRGVKGRPGNGPGPNRCGRVSCAYSWAIFWCNEDPTAAKELDSYNIIADAAQIIQDECKIEYGQRCFGWVEGQVFMKDRWSVIVRQDTHNC
ncbi:hypothetical protein B0T20DRAFT_388235 [Sordaria brevicollis]|uniref:Uncharacterized protein n=1 Tax=Sordaria brevicollis TaxID=83679 RepID=A0AAE0PM40_SORBR|nr:hypothetical protein B0T20DRAFT_388235 [Sordaria brevicollis]